MWSFKKLQLPSFLSSNLALLVFIPLVLLSIIACTLIGQQSSSSFVPFSSVWKWKSIGIFNSYSLRSLSSYEEQHEASSSFTSPFNNNSFHENLVVEEESIPHQPPQVNPTFPLFYILLYFSFLCMCILRIYVIYNIVSLSIFNV